MNLATFAGVEARYTDPVTGEAVIPASTVRGWADANLRGFTDWCVVKPGGKRLVDLDAMERWLEEQRGRTERRADDRPVLRLRRRLPPFEEAWGAAGSHG